MLIAERDDDGFGFFNVKDDWDEKKDLKKSHADEFEKIKASYKERVKGLRPSELQRTIELTQRERLFMFSRSKVEILRGCSTGISPLLDL